MVIIIVQQLHARAQRVVCPFSGHLLLALSRHLLLLNIRRAPPVEYALSGSPGPVPGPISTLSVLLRFGSERDFAPAKCKLLRSLARPRGRDPTCEFHRLGVPGSVRRRAQSVNCCAQLEGVALCGRSNGESQIEIQKLIAAHGRRRGGLNWWQSINEQQASRAPSATLSPMFGYVAATQGLLAP